MPGPAARFAGGDLRLLLLIGSMDSGGSQTQARLLLESLAPRGVRARVVCYRGSEDVFDTLRAADVAVEILPRPVRYVWPVQIFGVLARLVRRHQIDVVHAFLEDFVILAPPLRLMYPSLAVVTSRRSLSDYVQHRRLRLMAWSSRWASTVVANSRAVAESVRSVEGDYGSRVRVVQNGMPLPRAVDAEERRQARRKFGLDPKAFVVAYVAHFRHGKGYDRLPEIVRSVVGGLPHARVLLAGRTNASKHYRRTYSEFNAQINRLCLSGHVCHLGLLPDSRPLLAASDVLLNFSDSEGMSNSIMEAMALGIPVVASDVGGTPELIRDGCEGWLVPARDAGAAAERLRQLATDPTQRQRMGEAGRARIERGFPVTQMVDAYMQIYEESARTARRDPRSSLTAAVR